MKLQQTLRENTELRHLLQLQYNKVNFTITFLINFCPDLTLWF